MKQKYFFLAAILGAGLLALPNLTRASADISLKEVIMTSTANTTTKTFTAKAGDTDMIFMYTTATKVTGATKEIVNYDDWSIGDKFSVTGQIVGYENNKIKIWAQTIKYDSTGKQIKVSNGYISNVDATNNKVWVATKINGQYETITITGAGQSNGPRLVGFSTINDVTPGAAVGVTQIWSKSPSQLLKTLSLTSQTNKTPIHVVSMRRETGNYIFEDGYPASIKIKKGEKISIQNRTGLNLYLKAAPADSGKFNPRLSNFVTIKSGSSSEYSIVTSAITGAFNLPLKTAAIDTNTVVISVPVEIIGS